MDKVRIMVVEDESIVAEDLRRTLEKMGYAVPGVAASGEDAIHQARALRPSLVLMDIALKGRMDGIEAAERIRTDLHIPIVFLTAYADDETLQRARVSEPFGYILKPFENRELHTTIQMALHKHRMEQERENLIAELEAALARIKVLSGLLPICASCKRIRDAQGHWQQLEVYIHDHSDAEFSHGICPDCAQRLYPEFAQH